MWQINSFYCQDCCGYNTYQKSIVSLQAFMASLCFVVLLNMTKPAKIIGENNGVTSQKKPEISWNVTHNKLISEVNPADQ